MDDQRPREGPDGKGAADRTVLRFGGSCFWIPASVFTLVCLAMWIIVLVLNGGQFSYTIDDPYIHLALAENIAAGEYGVNPGERCAPASSILWPLLLAPWVSFGVDHYMPLVLNYISALGLIAFFSALVNLVTAGRDPGQKRSGWLLVLFLIPAVNLPGLIFTGMEQPLQVLLAAAVVLGLIVESRDGRIPWWLALAVIAGPLIRYENTALSLLALCCLGARRRYRTVLVCGAATAAGLIAFSVFLKAMGLGWFPSSVQAKSFLVEHGTGPLHILSGAFMNLLVNVLNVRLVAVLAFSLCFLLVAALTRGRPREERLLALFGVGTVLIQTALGRFGGYGRYEIYALAVVFVLLVYLYRDRVAWLWQQQAYKAALVLLVAVLVVSPYYLFTTAASPLAANNIYEQQHQMHRFATEYHKGPVAINDLGWVSYRNDYYVLDLFGLALKESQIRRKADPTGRWMDEMTRRKGTQLVMIYDDWFPRVPEGWVLLGQLHLGKKKISPAGTTVSFYGTDPDAAPGIVAKLRQFEKTLPQGARFVLAPRFR